jgi:hypothetical protein
MSLSFQRGDLMKWLPGVLVAAILLPVLGGPARGDDKDTTAIVDKAIKALGGEAKLKGKAVTWKAKGTITFMGNDNEFTTKVTAQGLDRYHGEFEGEFGDNKVKGVTVLDGKKGWRKFNDMGGEMDKDALANEKRTNYLRIVPVTVVPLKGKGFKVKDAGEKKVAGQAAVGLDVTGPDGKTFKLYFDKKTGLPVQLVAKVRGFMGEEFTQETTFRAYKEFGGVKKATKVESKRDGEKFLTETITEFKVLDKVPAGTFAEPK